MIPITIKHNDNDTFTMSYDSNANSELTYDDLQELVRYLLSFAPKNNTLCHGYTVDQIDSIIGTEDNYPEFATYGHVITTKTMTPQNWKIPVIRMIRMVYKVGLREAKDISEDWYDKSMIAAALLKF